MAHNTSLCRDVKLCLLGDHGVGKSSLVLRFVSDRFENYVPSTIGASFMSKTIFTNEGQVTFHIWDTAGEERYVSLAPLYYRGSTAAIIVYDITAEQSFSSVQRWITKLQQWDSSNSIIAIAGNKKDKANERTVDKMTGLEYAESINAIFYETSALTAENVSEIFEEIANRLPLERNGCDQSRPGSPVVLHENRRRPYKKCCKN